MLGMLITQIREGIDRIARARHPKLHVTGSEVEIVCDSQLDHAESVLLVCQGFLFFEGILWTDHKPHLIQLATFVDRLSYDQMPDVNLI